MMCAQVHCKVQETLGVYFSPPAPCIDDFKVGCGLGKLVVADTRLSGGGSGVHCRGTGILQDVRAIYGTGTLPLFFFEVDARWACIWWISYSLWYSLWLLWLLLLLFAFTMLHYCMLQYINACHPYFDMRSTKTVSALGGSSNGFISDKAVPSTSKVPPKLSNINPQLMMKALGQHTSVWFELLWDNTSDG
jgi:hypothetical protein